MTRPAIAGLGAHIPPITWWLLLQSSGNGRGTEEWRGVVKREGMERM